MLWHIQQHNEEVRTGYFVMVVFVYGFLIVENPKAVYVCINYGEAVCPKEIERQSICIDGDIGNVLCQLYILGEQQIQKLCINGCISENE